MSAPQPRPSLLDAASSAQTSRPAPGTDTVWHGAWTTPAMRPSTAPWFATWAEQGFHNHSLRQIVRVSAGGTTVRIRLSNAYGTAPLRLAGASIGHTLSGATMQPGSLRTLLFEGAASVTVPAHGRAVSDPVTLPTQPLQKLTITLYFQAATGPATYHQLSMATTYRATGNHLHSPAATAYSDKIEPGYGSWYYLEGIETAGGPPWPPAVVAFGDSLTDGFGATIDGDDRYPDLLAARLIAAGRPRPVLNAGIGSNKLLTASALGGDAGIARFTRDVLDQPRVGTVIALIGINDLQQSDDAAGGAGRDVPPVTARRLIGGHRALIRAAHARNVRIIGATLTPYRGAAGWSVTGESVRAQVNEWIRGSGAYDAVVDFARALALDSGDRIREDLHIGDHLHPNPAGYQAMADAVDLAALEQ
ncbi:SGNH/GDSL hydrolase family protein [Streptomyces sp. NPDC016845]|uniref:SGNH/GDSL hydrolase family protein n=1 Tax=Streptomyces sp. NPDC016845 TaxID=3364972 RepID=UPI0037880F1E